MERIKQAIEKVSRQHSRVARHLVGSNQNIKGVSSSSRDSQDEEELENFVYKHTRVVRPNVEHLESHRLVAFNNNDVMSMNFDLLRTQVLQQMKENGWRTLAITSPTPESGKTVIGINLAMSIARLTNQSAMLVDFDLRRPKVGAYLGIPMEKSLNDLLDGTADLSEVLINPDLPRLVVLATKYPVKKSSETLASNKISNLINEWRMRYESRIVIFDLPPLLVSDDALTLLPHVDCVLMVVADGMSTKREIDDSLRLLSSSKLLGIVLNKAEIEPSSYYY